MAYETKDSGSRAEYASGMVRDTEEGKARFDLLFPENVPYAAQMLTRFADLMARGAKKYEARNWEKARGLEELARYKSSALRHLTQWLAGETDEDHAAAVMFNLTAAETVKWRRANLEASTARFKASSPRSTLGWRKRPKARARPWTISTSTACLSLGFHTCQLDNDHRGKHWAHGEQCIPLGLSWSDFEVC